MVNYAKHPHSQRFFHTYGRDEYVLQWKSRHGWLQILAVTMTDSLKETLLFVSLTRLA